MGRVNLHELWFAWLKKGCVEFHFLRERNLFPFPRLTLALLETA